MGFNVKAKRIEKFLSSPKGGKGGKRCRSRTASPIQKEESKTEEGDYKCAREGCDNDKHQKQPHGYCCGMCKNGKEGHGNGCSVNVEARQAERKAAREAK